ncbi:MAG: hypothetical protein LBJ64_02295 [Deltaproteobacteria bacterium]|jgi:DNA-directed RNA polymerase sigma subunit (sigma70/sigma32)|nr:hypothetical protein [Deltaproteobacteria bacterium]
MPSDVTDSNSLSGKKAELEKTKTSAPLSGSRDLSTEAANEQVDAQVESVDKFLNGEPAINEPIMNETLTNESLIDETPSEEPPNDETPSNELLNGEPLNNVLQSDSNVCSGGFNMEYVKKARNDRHLLDESVAPILVHDKHFYEKILKQYADNPSPLAEQLASFIDENNLSPKEVQLLLKRLEMGFDDQMESRLFAPYYEEKLSFVEETLLVGLIQLYEQEVVEALSTTSVGLDQTQRFLRLLKSGDLRLEELVETPSRNGLDGETPLIDENAHRAQVIGSLRTIAQLYKKQAKLRRMLANEESEEREIFLTESISSNSGAIAKLLLELRLIKPQLDLMIERLRRLHRAYDLQDKSVVRYKSDAKNGTVTITQKLRIVSDNNPELHDKIFNVMRSKHFNRAFVFRKLVDLSQVNEKFKYDCRERTQELRSILARLDKADKRAKMAKKRLIQGYMFLAHSIAKKNAVRSGLSVFHLFGAGQDGLFEAANSFSKQRGRRFSTHAARKIRQAITRAIAAKAGPKPQSI